MTLKEILVSSAAALALAVAGTTLAEQPATPFVSGDEPMDVGDSAQIKAPDLGGKTEEKTEEMLKKEAGVLSGDTNPVDEGDAAQMKAPTMDAKAQEATEKALEKADDEAGAISGKYE
jgi:uncharacterized protein YjbJ (UPF0337 family)